MVELKALTSPPKGVKNAMLAVVALVGRRPQAGADEWKNCKRHLIDPTFLKTLMNFYPKTVTPENARYARKMLGGLSEDEMRNQSMAALSLARWANAVLEQAA